MKEYCCNCDEDTGAAGLGDDSIYTILTSDWHWMRDGKHFTTEAFVQVGPFCEACYAKLKADGLFE